MAGLGKWISGALGWALFGPIGGILGYFITSKLEELSEATSAQGEQQSWNQGQRNSFLMSLLVLSASVIKVDGKTTSQELSTLRNFFARNFGPQAGNEAEEIMQGLLDKEINLYEVCGQIRSCMDCSQRLQLFHYLVKAWGIFLGKFLDRDIQNRVILLIKTTEHEVLRWSVSRQYLICCFISSES